MKIHVFHKTLALVSVIFFVSLFVPEIGAESKRPVVGSDPVPIALSADGSMLLVTSLNYDGLALINTETGETRFITDSRNAGYYANLSPCGRYAAYKGFRQEGSDLLQAPMLYDIEDRQIIQLSEWSDLSGTPAVSPNGKIAYTTGSRLTILYPDFSLSGEYDLGGHVNILSFCPESSAIAYNPAPDKLDVLDLHTGKSMSLVDEGPDLYNPGFSPDGAQLNIQGVNGDIFRTDLSDPYLDFLGSGHHPAWVDEQTVSFIEYEKAYQKVTATYFVMADTKSRTRQRHLLGDEYIPSVTMKNNAVYQKKGNLYHIRIENDKAVSPRQIPFDSISALKDLVELSGRDEQLIMPLSTTEISGVPYIHQVYSTPSGFNGHAACGATSALMAIQYYELLPARSPSGWYVSNIYTYNNVTYDIWGNDPSRNAAYGGYGFIIQDTGWYGGPNRGSDHTSVWMRRYLTNHGLESAVDWSTTWNKLKNEIDKNDPFVLLNSLTSGGHYITTTGYVQGQYTAVFNDPYGDKNTPGYPSHDGLRVFYDWPGYNYGNQNLNTVHCYIYARGDFRPPSTEYASGDWVSTTASSLNFRNAPGTDTSVIRTLPRGTLARIREHEDQGIFRTGYYWWYVEIHETGETGWVVDIYIEEASSPCSINTPSQPDGPASGVVNESLMFTTSAATCECGANVEFRFDWNNGTYSSWSTSSPATHSWSSGGTYQIRARARCSDNTSEESTWSASRTVVIYEPPSAGFSADKKVVEPGDTIHFTDLSTGDITGWSWNFGDGSVSTIASTSHSYSETGAYTVTLEVSGPAGSDTITREQYIHVLETVEEYNALVHQYHMPAVMRISHSYDLHLTLRNTGSRSWEEGVIICLGAVGDEDPLTGSDYYRLGLANPVGSGELYTFHIPLYPEETGSFTTEWSMLKEGKFWFGETFSMEVRVDDRTGIENSTWHLFE